MTKVFSPLSTSNEVISAYGFEVEENCWEIYSDSETLSRVLALYHEIGINVVPVFEASMDVEDFKICKVLLLSVTCNPQDIIDANYWLYVRGEYKVDVTMFDCLPADVPHLVESFQD